MLATLQGVYDLKMVLLMILQVTNVNLMLL